MSRIVVYTQAYNAEKTLRGTMDSVLRQTYTDFVYYVADHCSTDRTGEIIREYAAKDPRVRPLYYDRDDGTGLGAMRVLTTLERLCADIQFDWLCMLDADDFYEPEFLREMLEFVQRERLDMAVCGSRVVEAGTGKVLKRREAKREIVISGEGFGEYFPGYHQFMRETWAKLTAKRVVEQTDWAALRRNPSVGSDTMLCFAFLRHCGRMGITPKVLHRYVVSPDSGSYRLDPNRIGADAIQHWDTVAFLREKVGEVSPENSHFLYRVYNNALTDTLSVLLRANNASLEEKLAGVRQLLCIDVTQELIGQKPSKNLDSRRILQQVLRLLDSVGDQAVLYEDAIWLGLTVTSLLGDQEGYIRFSKLQIRYLLNTGQKQEAAAQLGEWTAILPDDAELAAMRQELGPNRFILLGLTEYTEVAVNRLRRAANRTEILAICDVSGERCGSVLSLSDGPVPVIGFEELARRCGEDAENVGILLTITALRWNVVLDALRQCGVEHVYAAPTYAYRETDLDFRNTLFQVPMDRPMLTYYEYHVTDHCNLNCYQCGNFSNAVTEPMMGDLEQYKRDVKRLSELFWNVGQMRFQGGEPLLNPELPEFIRVTREAFPHADLGILSNGLLIPNASAELFEAMRKYHVFFWLSGYPPTYKRWNQIQARCNAEKVPVSIMPLIQEWREESVKAMEMPPSDNWAEAEKYWRTCGARDSHFIKDGYLYYCCFTVLTMPILYQRMGRDIRKNHMLQHLDELRFDLSDPNLDGWTISQKLDHVHETCLYCVNRWPNFRKVPWRTCPPSQFRAEDYLWDPPSLTDHTED